MIQQISLQVFRAAIGFLIAFSLNSSLSSLLLSCFLQGLARGSVYHFVPPSDISAQQWKTLDLPLSASLCPVGKGISVPGKALSRWPDSLPAHAQSRSGLGGNHHREGRKVWTPRRDETISPCHFFPNILSRSSPKNYHCQLYKSNCFIDSASMRF